MTRCCVSHCSENATHKFPRDPKMRKLWLKAIRRVDLTPKSATRICRNHFTESDFIHVSKYTGIVHQHKYLKKSAIPSIFPWQKKTVAEQIVVIEERFQTHKSRKRQFYDVPLISENCNDIVPFQKNEEIADVNVSHNEDIFIPDTLVSRYLNVDDPLDKTSVSQGTQSSNILRLFATEQVLTNNESVNFYTGLESYSKFTLVLSTLLPMAYEIKCDRGSKNFGLSVEDQFLMVLIKLRQNKPNFQIGNFFGVSQIEVSNVIITWIDFISDTWSLTEIGPCREVAKLYMPHVFTENFPPKFLVQKQNQPKVYSNKHKAKSTLKIMVGSTMEGQETCNEKLQTPSVMLKKDQELASQRIHIERLIALTKTYKIITSELNPHFVPWASKIFHICVVLCHFREGIGNNYLKNME